ncbi:MAG TPA: dihydroflavonol 4-reductase [Flavobacteriales bacterium]|nr:dihydroflavonol 4-reductase [Flavobacteriales bacterium]HRE73983.1 SDR family oxidoreductase [Flavobacteriales bacterium]HRJ34443.1 SDR family oxidoreductase [Flavobacteriales bacterium]HRJ39530.1 SDR family oxidoreductase [Flavobacteriales bacterium]
MDKSLFITGADGLLGSNSVRELLAQGYSVRALIQPGRKVKSLEGLPIEKVEGDLLDETKLRNAMKGCRYVIHGAASTAMWPDNNPVVRKVNIEGTRCLLNACKENGVERLVYIGTANSFGAGSIDQPGNESKPYTAAKYKNDYMASKYEAHQLVLDYVKKGLNAVIVNPTFMLGAYDSAPSSGAMILAVVNQQVPGYSPGGKNYICVKDAAKGVVNAIEKGRTGECYILGNENLNFKDAFAKMANVAGVKAPGFAIPKWVLLLYGGMGSTVARITGKAPKVSYTIARISCDEFYYSSLKAVKELDLPQTPIENGIREALDWFKENGYLKN